MAEAVTAGGSPAVCYADRAFSVAARIVAHAQVAEQTFRIRLECPTIAATAVPGQFAMVRIPSRNDPLLARPLAVYDTFAEGRHADFIYLVHGKFTTALKDIPVGDELLVWGPLGNGFDLPPVDHLVLVAGGIGNTALLALGRERLGGATYGNPARVAPRARRVTFCWGARHAAMFADVDDFRAAGMEVHLATLDGSAGRQGTVVDLLDDVIAPEEPSLRVACCGPEPMMAAVTQWAQRRGVPCDVSLEAPMACGIGICFTCVAKVRDAEGGWDYRRTCIEGPVFDGSSIVW
ncbi:MAG: dihydroorotate dehydrogenase electron transfer subunit [Planctomycetota bacterium]|jgi:dihydroorotate dehydrogenase electron transfer subunit|nr:dihydroorotate dehydrogenase electron transfer subunit [Planctomycetota bacterium]